MNQNESHLPVLSSEPPGVSPTPQRRPSTSSFSIPHSQANTHRVQELSLASLGIGLSVGSPVRRPASTTDLTKAEYKPAAAVPAQPKSPRQNAKVEQGKKTNQSPTTSSKVHDKAEPVKKRKQPSEHEISDSENSEDESGDENLNGDSGVTFGPVATGAGQSSSSSNQASGGGRLGGEWVLLQGLKSGQLYDQKPSRYEGFVMKSRKWPMKGFHKRYFVLDKGILTYAKSPSDLEKGKSHGTMDIGLSVVAYKKKDRRIDVDADDLIYHLKKQNNNNRFIAIGDDLIYHLKAKSIKSFDEWIEQLRQHRLYRQHEISYGTRDVPKLVEVTTPLDEYSPIATPLSPASPAPPLPGSRGSGGGSFKSCNLDRAQGRITTWLIDSHGHEAWNKEVAAAQLKIFGLGSLLEQLQGGSGSATHSSTGSSSGSHGTYSSNNNNDLPPDVNKKDKANKRYALGKCGYKKDRKSKDRMSAPNGLITLPASSSNPNLFLLEAESSGNVMGESMSLSTEGGQVELHEQFCAQAKTVLEALKGICRMVATERERLKQAVEQENSSVTHSSSGYVLSLKQALTDAVKQNADLRGRLERIHSDSAGFESVAVISPLLLPPGSVNLSGSPTDRDLSGTLRMVSSESVDSGSEFYDANERLDYSISDESEEDEEEEEDNSDTETTAALTSETDPTVQFSNFPIRRRSKLPSPRMESDISVWNLLCKNIGKDLSKIAMPVSLNEPLNALQRLCEELEYSELLDRAVEINDPYERMVHIAAFTVSAYAATCTRASQKPFNPVLGETYECVREDKGWKFVAEQVSHHPPIAACICESRNFTFQQDTQVKTKFWGKSMEVQPIGLVTITLPKFKEKYSYNKATTCIHNILGGQRWVDHYGEVNIVNETLNIRCKLTYVKSSYWSSKKHELYGVVTDSEGRTVHPLFGRWNEGVYYGQSHAAKCIWRPGALPPESDIYYGFTRFAIELNEIDSEQIHLYPITDSRFRPDQRLLEEGKLDEAEQEKQRVETLQRDQRKKREESGAIYEPQWFRRIQQDGEERYVYNGKYWDVRKDPGFMKISLPKLW